MRRGGSLILLLMEREGRGDLEAGSTKPSVEKKRGGSFIVHVQGLIFRMPDIRASNLWEGRKHLANASLPLWARTECETRILVTKKDESLSLSLSFDPPPFSLGVKRSSFHSRISFVLRLIGPVERGGEGILSL